MNREEAENLVIEATRRTDKLSLIRSAINLALEQVSTHRYWSDLMTEATAVVSSGSSSVSLSEDVARIVDVRVLDGAQSYTLDIRTKVWVTQRSPNSTSLPVGRPCYGYLQGKVLHVTPVTDQEYTVSYTYYRLHPSLASATDQILIRAAASAVIAYATYWVFKSIEKHEDAAQWLATYSMNLASAERVDSTNSVVKHQADQRLRTGVYPAGFWNDPFFGVERHG